jgi:Arc/MetJ-type ribon-helix-helix transcriptional regulator
MSYPFPPDVDELVRTQMALGGYASEDDVLREALTALAERREVLDDIRAGLAELEQGGGRPLNQVDAELRQRYGIRREP